jgi:hypothetical protein
MQRRSKKASTCNAGGSGFEPRQVHFSISFEARGSGFVHVHIVHVIFLKVLLTVFHGGPPLFPCFKD